MESIFIFVIIAIVSTLFNKDKRTKRTHQRTKDVQPKQTNPQGQARGGSLGDLVKQLTTDFDNVFKEKSPNQEQEEEVPYPVTYEYQQYQQSVDYEQQEVESKPDKIKVPSKSINKKTVYDDEIGDVTSALNIKFNEEALLQGIIMSEVLGKPKALR